MILSNNHAYMAKKLADLKYFSFLCHNKDIVNMEDEREQLAKRVDRVRKKVKYPLYCMYTLVFFWHAHFSKLTIHVVFLLFIIHHFFPPCLIFLHFPLFLIKSH